MRSPFAINYGVERVHSGMIAYLCGLWNKGETNRDATRSALSAFGIEVEEGVQLQPRLEYQIGRVRCDLVVFAGSDGSALTVIETKVDSPEGKGEAKKQQEAAKTQLKGTPQFVYLTLGAASFLADPTETDFKVIKLCHLIDALSGVKIDDCFVSSWFEALASECEFHRNFLRSDWANLERRGQHTYRLALLDGLRAEMVRLKSMPNVAEPSVYTVGKGPDYILHFGRASASRYMEINNDGRLHLKIEIQQVVDLERERKTFWEFMTRFPELKGHVVTRKPSERARTVTLGSFDIGLTYDKAEVQQRIEPPDDLRAVAKQVGRVLECFYREYETLPARA